jgi:hypothetical protein
MKLSDRVQRALDTARSMLSSRRKRLDGFECKGKDIGEVARLVEAALLPESVPVVAEIMDQVEEYESRPPHLLPNGKTRALEHGFVSWLWGLRDGWATLPTKLPHSVLLSWRDGFTHHPARGSPVPIFRCEDCWMVLPNYSPSDAAILDRCPVCAGVQIAPANLWKPPGAFNFKMR